MAQTPKIFLEAHNIKNRTSGLGVFNYELIKALSKINNEYELILNISNTSLLKELNSPLVKAHKYYSFQRYSLFRIREKYNIWHSLNQNTKLEPYYNMHYVLTIHDIILVINGDKYRQKQLIEKIKRSSAIAYISHFVKEQTHQFFDIPSHVKEYVIYNGNNIDIQLDTSKYISSVSVDKPYLYAIGEFQERKNYISLLKMMRVLKDFNLIISGNNNNEYGSKMKKYIIDCKMEDRVFLTGRITEEEKHFYIKNSKGFLFPSTQEGFGLPILEAMSFGKPVFLSNLTSIPEIGGEDAFYWDNFDPEEMAKVIVNGLEIFYEDEKSFSEKMIKRSKFFSWDKAAHEYLQVYKSLI